MLILIVSILYHAPSFCMRNHLFENVESMIWALCSVGIMLDQCEPADNLWCRFPQYQILSKFIW
jgi:hypothetical protein